MKLKDAISGKRSAIEQAKSTVLIWVIVASILVSLSIVSINFLWDLRGYNSRVVSAKRQAESTLEQNLSVTPQLQQNYQLLEDSEVNSQFILDALPSLYDFPALATSVASLVSRSGLVIESFNGNDQGEVAISQQANPVPVEMPFSLTVEGSYDDVKKFVENLNRSTRPMKIEKLSLSGTNANMQAELEITSFYQPAVSINTETTEIK